MENPKNILLMKVGPYCGYSLEDIVKIKQSEEKLVGKFYWGFGGVFCRPNLIKSFVSYTKSNPIVLFTETKSNFCPTNSNRFRYYSEDNICWKPLDKDVLLVGNTSAPHFAVTMKNFMKTELSIDLSDYAPFTSKEMSPSKNRRFDDYFKYRVDKACGVYNPSNSYSSEKIIKISYMAELVEPYCIYIK